MLALTLFCHWFGTSFVSAQVGAAVIAMTTNFFINKFLPYHDRMLRGWQMLHGSVSCAAVSFTGVLANVGVAVYFFESANAVWFESVIAGIIVGAAWNFAAYAVYTWRV